MRLWFVMLLAALIGIAVAIWMAVGLKYLGVF